MLRWRQQLLDNFQHFLLTFQLFRCNKKERNIQQQQRKINVVDHYRYCCHYCYSSCLSLIVIHSNDAFQFMKRFKNRQKSGFVVKCRHSSVDLARAHYFHIIMSRLNETKILFVVFVDDKKNLNDFE
jgi:hypothetical protein